MSRTFYCKHNESKNFSSWRSKRAFLNCKHLQHVAQCQRQLLLWHFILMLFFSQMEVSFFLKEAGYVDNMGVTARRDDNSSCGLGILFYVTILPLL